MVICFTEKGNKNCESPVFEDLNILTVLNMYILELLLNAAHNIHFRFYDKRRGVEIQI